MVALLCLKTDGRPWLVLVGHTSGLRVEGFNGWRIGCQTICKLTCRARGANSSTLGRERARGKHVGESKSTETERQAVSTKMQSQPGTHPGTTRAKSAQGTPTQGHVSLSIPVYEDQAISYSIVSSNVGPSIEVPRGDKMLYSGTEPGSYITKYVSIRK